MGGASTHAASAPGRVNLIGEHTDTSEGYVLPIAIPQRARVELALRGGRTIRVASAAFPADGVVARSLDEDAPRGHWSDYPWGVAKALEATGHGGESFDACFDGEIPLGAGLSSSAAMEIALLRALRSARALPIDDVALARIAQAAEVDHVGVPVGVMDPMVSSVGAEGVALLLDTRTLATEAVAFEALADLVVVDSGVTHALGAAGGTYAARRAEVDRAAALLGVPTLRDALAVPAARLASLPSPLDRRARHVVTENRRVLAVVEALRAGDMPTVGAALDASHASLRDDFEVSVPDVDRLAQLAREDADVFGARLTGGGFGGAVVALARPGRGRDVARRVARAYDLGGAPCGRVILPLAPTPGEPRHGEVSG